MLSCHSIQQSSVVTSWLHSRWLRGARRWPRDIFAAFFFPCAAARTHDHPRRNPPQECWRTAAQAIEILSRTNAFYSEKKSNVCKIRTERAIAHNGQTLAWLRAWQKRRFKKACKRVKRCKWRTMIQRTMIQLAAGRWSIFPRFQNKSFQQTHL